MVPTGRKKKRKSIGKRRSRLKRVNGEEMKQNQQADEIGKRGGKESSLGGRKKARKRKQRRRKKNKQFENTE